MEQQSDKDFMDMIMEKHEQEEKILREDLSEFLFGNRQEKLSKVILTGDLLDSLSGRQLLTLLCCGEIGRRRPGVPGPTYDLFNLKNEENHIRKEIAQAYMKNPKTYLDILEKRLRPYS